MKVTFDDCFKVCVLFGVFCSDREKGTCNEHGEVGVKLLSGRDHSSTDHPPRR